MTISVSTLEIFADSADCFASCGGSMPGSLFRKLLFNVGMKGKHVELGSDWRLNGNGNSLGLCFGLFSSGIVTDCDVKGAYTTFNTSFWYPKGFVLCLSFILKKNHPHPPTRDQIGRYEHKDQVD